MQELASSWWMPTSRSRCCMKWRLHALCPSLMSRSRETMQKLTWNAAIGMMIVLGTTGTVASAADTRTEARLDIAPGGTVSVLNSAGSVNVHSGGGRQVTVVALSRSAKIEIDRYITPDKGRVEISTH